MTPSPPPPKKNVKDREIQGTPRFFLGTPYNLFKALKGE